MSADEQGTTTTPRWPRIRITRLRDLLNQAKNWNDLCEWLFNNSHSGRYQMYWEVPDGCIVRFGSRRIYGGYGEFTTPAAEPQLPPDWSPLPNVKFVRLAPRIAEQVARQACLNGTYFKPAIRVDRFPGGLSVPDEAHVPSGLLEALPAFMELHIQSISPTATNAWEMMDVDPTHVYVDDNVYSEIRSQLEVRPHIQGSAESSAVETSEQPEIRGIAPAIAATDGATPAPIAQELAEASDPYNLKGRAGAVYALYQLAEQCSRTAAFGSEPSLRKRHSIAEAMLLDIIKTKPELQKVFGDTRLKQAVKFIDMGRNPKSGSKVAASRTWPTPAADEILSKPDDRRRPFLSQTLELAIHATEQWLAWNEAPPSGGRRKALDCLLTDYGLILSVERSTLFPIITFDNDRFQKAPKSPAPSTSRVRASGARHVSRPRGA